MIEIHENIINNNNKSINNEFNTDIALILSIKI